MVVPAQRHRAGTGILAPVDRPAGLHRTAGLG